METSFTKDQLDSMTDEELHAEEELLSIRADSAGEEIVVVAESILNESNLAMEHLVTAALLREGKIDSSTAVTRVRAAESLIENHPDFEMVDAEEGILSETFKRIKNIFSSVHKNMMMVADYYQFMNRLWSVQDARLRRIQNNLTYATQRSSDFKVGINKYICFGDAEQPAATFQEYQAEFKKMSEMMTTYLAEMGELARDDLFSSLQWWKDATIGDLEDFFEDRLQSVDKTLKAIQSRLHTKPERNLPAFTEHKSPVCLGLFYIYVRTPKPGSWHPGDFDSQFIAHRYYYTVVQRLMKIRLKTLVDGSVRWTADRTAVSDLVHSAQGMIREVERLLSYSTKLSTAGAYGSASLNDMETGPISDLRAMYKTVALYNRICSMIAYAVPSAATVSHSNVKQAAKIAEAAVKAMR